MTKEEIARFCAEYKAPSGEPKRKNNPPVRTTGHRFIAQQTDFPFSFVVTIRRSGLRFARRFSTLREAIAARDEAIAGAPPTAKKPPTRIKKPEPRSCGHRNIHRLESAARPYIVIIRRKRAVVYRKSFVTLEEAIRERDKTLTRFPDTRRREHKRPKA